MSLADELLADLEDGDDFIDETLVASIDRSDRDSGPDGFSSVTNPIPATLDAHRTNIKSESTISLTSIRQLARMIDSIELKRIMEEIEKRNDDKSASIDKNTIDGPIEAHPEYRLIVDANNITVEIDDDIALIHKFVRDRYSKLLPELDSLIPNTLEYLMAVREIGNNLSQVKTNQKLAEFLTQATIMVVNMTASTKRIEPLEESVLRSVQEACDCAIQLNSDKIKIIEFVESRMNFIAPNLSVIVGSNIAAKLMGLAGGISNLSKMPACNVEVLGSRKRNLYGFSAHSITSHTGIVFHCELVQSQPPDLRRKAARQVANKCTICARVDATHASPEGLVGQSYREKIEKSLDKLKEPPPVKKNKALPAPIDQSRKKRGGKRVRRMKERMAMTEFRKQTNRMNFAEIEDDAYQQDLGFSTGVVGKSGMGRIRAPQVDEKTKVRISKTLKKNMQKQQQVYGGSSTIKKHVSGTASSVAFTPLQGLEITNPHAAEVTGTDSTKYFSSTSGFVSVIKRIA